MIRPRISIVLPVYNERENIAACLRGLWQALSEHDHEILVCYDFDEDTTLPAIAAMTDKPPSVRLVKNSLGRGAAFAIRAGFEAAQGDLVVVTMADLCDPPEVIPRMAAKIREEGADVVAGSRYMRGGSQSGGPWLKRTISRCVGWSMWWIAKLGTHDATTNFRAYSKRFLDSVTVESKTSFDIALELTVKAHLAGAKVSEVPSSWIDRTAGESRFRMWKWMPNYLRWYVRAMLPPLSVLALLVGLSLWGWVRVSRMQETALRSGEALFGLTAACVLMLWLARRVRGRTRTSDLVQVLLWLLPWQLWPIGGTEATAIAVASSCWTGFTCGWRRTVRGLVDIATGAGRRSVQSTTGLILLCLAVWLSAVIIPRQIATNAPDMCWSRSLGYALTHALHFGSDIAFTYGPLGYFATGIFDRDLFLLKVLAFEGAFKLLASAFLTLAALRLSGTLDRAVYFVALLVLPYNYDSFAFVVVAAVTAHLLTNPNGSPVIGLSGAFILAAIALTKVNLVVVAGACILAVAYVRRAEIGWAGAARVLCTFILFYLGLWLVSGQSFLDLPSYFVRSAQIARGYNEGESLSGYERELYFGIALGLLMLILALLYGLQRPRTRARITLAVVFAMLVYVAFKTGFVRIADHPVIFFVFVGSGAFLIPPPLESAAPIRALAFAIRQACFVLVALCLPSALGLDVRGWPGLINLQLARSASNVEGLIHLARVQKEVEVDEVRAGASVELPAVKAEVGRETIDMVSCEQGVVYLNGLEWRPRPVFMSYAAMTPELLEWNARFFESDRAPRYVLSKLDSIDQRLLTMDDGLALQVIGRDYKPVLVENGYVLLRRNSMARRDVAPRTVLRKKIVFGERVEMEGLEGRSHVLALDIAYTPWGKFWMTAFKAPPIWMHVWTDAGGETIVRIVPGMMKTGVLFDPFIATQRNWVQWLVGGELARVRSFVIDMPDSPLMYAGSIDLELLDGDAQAPVRDEELVHSSGTMTFDPSPTEITVSAPTMHRDLNGQDVLVLQAPSTIRFDMTKPGTYMLNAVYGLVPEAYTVHSSDGASFSALLVEGMKKTILLHRFLNPLRRVSDRGMQILTTEFTTTGPATLYLCTRPGIHNDPAFDWACWGSVRVMERKIR